MKALRSKGIALCVGAGILLVLGWATTPKDLVIKAMGPNYLYKAIADGRYDKVVRYVESGGEINPILGDRYTASPLFCACDMEDPTIALYLIKAGAKVDIKDSEGNTPLHVATRLYSTRVVQELLKHGANPNVQDNSGRTPLDHVLNGQNKDSALLLVRAGAQTTDVEVQGRKGPARLLDKRRTATDFLIEHMGKLPEDEVVEFIRQGVDLGCSPRTSMDFMQHAISALPSKRVVSAILDAGYDPNTRVDCHGESWPILHFACYYSAEEAVKVLIDRGADVKAKTSNGLTVLDMLHPERVR